MKQIIYTILIVGVLLGIALLLDGMNGEEAPTYTSEQYGFTFEYPETFDLMEYDPASLSIGTQVGESFESVADVRVYQAGEDVGIESDDAFLLETMRNMCAADGPGETIYCTGMEARQPIETKSGVKGEVFYMQRVHENLTTRAQETSGFGPIFAFDIKENVPGSEFAILVVEPPASLEVSEVDSELLRAIAETVQIQAFDEASE